MNEKSLDLRSRYSQKVIMDAMLELLNEKPLDKITVTDICTRAQINRGTFYKYYENVIDLYEKTEDSVIDEIIHPNYSDVDCNSCQNVEYIKGLLSTIRDSEKLQCFIRTNEGINHFAQKALHYMEDKTIQTWLSTYDSLDTIRARYIYHYIVGGYIEVITLWVCQGFVEPIEDICELVCTINLSHFGL
ncbi:MAG: TetR/AcrR family transcriptional regulator [Lachnospira sp.]|nr:TetR/AcrR family transcriptional regulator [Lachnospira sp.]